MGPFLVLYRQAGKGYDGEKEAHIMYEEITAQARTAIQELLEQAKLNTSIYKQVATYDSGKMYANKLSEKLKMNGKSMSFTFTGYVEAGIENLADANINVNSKTNVITIDNIKISITNVYIDPSSIKDAKQTKNIFNQLTIGDFTAAQSELEKKLINDAKEKIFKARGM